MEFVQKMGRVHVLVPWPRLLHFLGMHVPYLLLAQHLAWPDRRSCRRHILCAVLYLAKAPQLSGQARSDRRRECRRCLDREIQPCGLFLVLKRCPNIYIYLLIRRMLFYELCTRRD